jgi:hypothetical protein
LGWVVNLEDGLVASHYCPTCITPEENLEVAVNEATIDYNQNRYDPQGRVFFSDPLGENDGVIRVSRMPGGQRVSGFILMGKGVALVLCHDEPNTFICSSKALLDGVMQHADVLPMVLPGTHPSLWSSSQVKLVTNWAALADEFGWTVVYAGVLATFDGPLSRGAEGPSASPRRGWE